MNRKTNKEIILRTLLRIKNKHPTQMFRMLQDIGYTKVHVVDTSNGRSWDFTVEEFSWHMLEQYLGIVNPEFIFSPIDQYPMRPEELTSRLKSIDKNSIHATVYDITGQMRLHSPRFRLTGFIVFGAEGIVEIHGNINAIEKLLQISDAERQKSAERFIEAIGNTRSFNGDIARRYASDTFRLYRYNQLSEYNPDVFSEHSLDNWLSLANEVRKVHVALIPSEVDHNDRIFSTNFMYPHWDWAEDGLWARGTIRSRYDGKCNHMNIEKAIEGDPLQAKSLQDSADGIEHDVEYPFEYHYKFNSSGLIEAIHLFRDAEKMEKCYKVNTTNIDSILMAATKSAQASSDHAMAERIIKMSHQLYDAEQKNLAVTKLFKTFDTASINKDIAVDAIGQAIFQMMKEN